MLSLFLYFFVPFRPFFHLYPARRSSAENEVQPLPLHTKTGRNNRLRPAEETTLKHPHADKPSAYGCSKPMSLPIVRKNLNIQGTSRSPDLCSTLTAPSRSECFSDILRPARNHSDGIVSDLHRIPFSSIAGTCSHDKNCRNMNFYPIIIIGPKTLSTFSHTLPIPVCYIVVSHILQRRPLPGTKRPALSARIRRSRCALLPGSGCRGSSRPRPVPDRNRS